VGRYEKKTRAVPITRLKIIARSVKSTLKEIWANRRGGACHR